MFDKTTHQGTENTSIPKPLEASAYLALSKLPDFFQKHQVEALAAEKERIRVEIAEAMQPCY